MMKEKTTPAQIKGVNNGYVFYPLRRHSAILDLWFEGHIKEVFSITHTQTNETWCGVFTDVAHQIPWCGALKFGTPYQKGVRFPDVAETLCTWRTSCNIWCGAQYIVFPDVVYILFLAFPDMAYILYFLMWRTFRISWCGVQYIVLPDVAYILFFRHT